MYLLTNFIVKNFMKIIRVDPELWGHAILGPKTTQLLLIRIVSEKSISIIFLYFWTPFIVKNLNPYIKTRVTTHHFRAQNGAFAPKKKFFRNIIKIIFMHLLPLLLCKILEKLSEQIESYDSVSFLSPKWPKRPEWDFLTKIFHRILMCLSASLIVQN